MQGQRKPTRLLIILLVIALVSVMLTLSAQEKGKLPRTDEEKVKERLNQLPIVDYEAPEPSNPDERAKRRSNNKKFNAANGVKLNPLEVEVSTKHNEWELWLTSALPATQSSAIVIGEVIDAKAYLSEDKTNVYSEFKVRVNGILKNDDSEPITIGDSIITERLGGRVRTSSGHVATYQIAGQGTPQIGQRYVFFLGFNPYEAGTKSLTGPRGNMSRHILTAYELRAGKVFPLDNAGGKNFQDYKEQNESSFLDEIRRIVTASSQALPE